LVLISLLKPVVYSSNNKIGFAMDSKSKKEAIFTFGDCEAVILKCRSII